MNHYHHHTAPTVAQRMADRATTGTVSLLVWADFELV